ncbi:MAG TPA: glycosyltransferase family 39 protein [Chloroflexota bacterium]
MTAVHPRLTARRLRLTIGMLTLAGFLLRAYALGAKDLRGDESFAAVFSAQSLGAMWAGLGQSEPHPPLYYLLLHWMIAFAGPSNISLRTLSVCFGTLAIPALAVAAWQAFGARAAVLTALLTVCNPLLVWQAQDARMYAQLVGCSAVALAGTLAIVRHGRLRGRAGWATVVGAAATLLTHFYGLFVVVGLIAGLLVSGWRTSRDRQRALQRMALLLTLEALVLALPLLYHGRTALSGHPPFVTLSPGELLASIGQALAAGFDAPIPLRTPAGVIAILLTLVGVAVAWRCAAAPKRAKSNVAAMRAIALVCLSLLAPVAGLAALELLHPAYQPAYAAVLAPAWLLAVGALATPRWAWLGVAPALLLGLLAEQSLTTYAHSQKNLSFSQAALLLQHEGEPGDLVLTNYPDPTLNWVYSRQDGGALPILLEPAAMPVDLAALNRRMVALGEEYNRLWFWTLRNTAWDPQHATEIWLDRHTLPLATPRAGNVEFRLFETPRGFLAHTAPLPAVTFANQLRVRGAAWATGSVSAGSTLQVTLCWQAVTVPQGDYTAFVHLERGATLGGQDDHPPINGLNPTHTWQPGESFLDQYHVQVPATTTPGVYALRVGFYTPATLQRLPLQDAAGATIGDALTVGQVVVR